MSKLVRTNRGKVIHRAECHTLKHPQARPVEWPWADDKTMAELKKKAEFYGYRFCTRPCTWEDWPS